MSKPLFYKQCHLVRDATVHTTTYLPEKFAKIGETVRLKDEEGNWTSGWVVESASDHRISQEHLPDSHKAIKEHRKATGDALPKNG